MNALYILKGQKTIECEDILTWGMWLFEADRIVKKTQIDTGEEVSTVFLAFNYQWGDGPPLLFETMVFGGKFDGDCYRYSTWDEAVEGHNQVVEMVME